MANTQTVKLDLIGLRLEKGNTSCKLAGVLEICATESHSKLRQVARFLVGALVEQKYNSSLNVLEILVPLCWL